MKPLAIVSWSIVGAKRQYVGPTDPHARVAGTDGISGQAIVISRVVSAEGRTVTTRSGSRYQLMDAQLAYQEFCQENGIAVNWESPFGGVV